jgi:ubiquinone/menaquinone biosynthesis C-methylase UbiE
VKTIFDEQYQKYDAWYDEHRFAFLSEVEAVRMVLPGKGKGLEIGVGTGRFASSLGTEYGIDPSQAMLKFARQRGVKAQLGTGEKLPFSNGVFDYVTIINTLCFVEEPLKVLQESGRVLKESGIIIIGIIDRNNFLGSYYQQKKSSFYRQAHFFTMEEVTELLSQSGFQNFYYWQTLFSFPDDISQIEKPLKGFNRGGFIVTRAQKV